MNVVSFVTATLVLAGTLSTSGQETPASTPTPLSQLLAEAEANNPQLSAADHEAQAAKQMVPQATTLPDPEFTYQQLSVGSPKPFAGYTNSDFAYIGVGASQELPYPGKLRLRGQVAERDAQTKQAEIGVTRTNIADLLKADYLQLAYLQQTLGILRENEAVLDQLIQDATAHYQVGQGMQQDVLQAQVEHTKVVREIAMHHQEMGDIQAQLKGLLHRPQSSPDIVAEPLRESTLHVSSSDLSNSVEQNNPDVRMRAATVRQQDVALDSAKREGKPDFELEYMYQNTDSKYRDYYMLTFNMRLPHRSRVRAEVAEASERLAAAQSQLDSEKQKELTDVQRQIVAATSQDEVLKDYRQGLLPESEAIYLATLNSYSANRDTLAHVLSAYLSLVNLKLDYEQTLLDHETALAHLETLTGEAIR